MRNYRHNDYGTPCGSIYLVDIKVRNYHGKKKLVALYRFQASRSRKLEESTVETDGKYVFFNVGKEHTKVYIPKHTFTRLAGGKAA